MLPCTGSVCGPRAEPPASGEGAERHAFVQAQSVAAFESRLEAGHGVLQVAYLAKSLHLGSGSVAFADGLSAAGGRTQTAFDTPPGVDLRKGEPFLRDGPCGTCRDERAAVVLRA